MQKRPIKRGEIYYAHLNPVVGSEQGGDRPVLVTQNDVGNKYSPTTVIVPITCKLTKMRLPTHVLIPKAVGLTANSLALVEQIRTIDCTRLGEYIGRIGDKVQVEIDAALAVCVGIEKRFASKGELFELCLCSRCKKNFRNSGYVVVKKGWQATKEECDFCNARRGVIFGVFM